MSEPDAQLLAALSMLDDPDRTVQEAIGDHIASRGAVAARELRRIVVDGNASERRRDVAATIMLRMGLDRFNDEFARVLQRPRGIELEAGAFAIATIGYPELVVADYVQQLDTMASMIEARLHNVEADAATILKAFNGYLIEDLGFGGCAQERYYEPDNSFLNRVIDRRMGIPISLSVLYITIGGRLGLPIRGVGFPYHYLVRIGDASWFVDPFNGGRIVTREECVRTLRAVGVELAADHIEGASTVETLQRMLRNLAEIYRSRTPWASMELEHAIDELEAV